jgi:hypothetical protein
MPQYVGGYVPTSPCTCCSLFNPCLLPIYYNKVVAKFVDAHQPSSNRKLFGDIRWEAAAPAHWGGIRKELEEGKIGD